MIRLATLEDTPRILELFNSDDFLRGSEDDFYTADDIRQYLSINVRRIYLYDRDSKIVGAVCLDLMTICREIFVFLLIVDKAWQGRGYRPGADGSCRAAGRGAWDHPPLQLHRDGQRQDAACVRETRLREGQGVPLLLQKSETSYETSTQDQSAHTIARWGDFLGRRCFSHD